MKVAFDFYTLPFRTQNALRRFYQDAVPSKSGLIRDIRSGKLTWRKPGKFSSREGRVYNYGQRGHSDLCRQLGIHDPSSRLLRWQTESPHLEGYWWWKQDANSNHRVQLTQVRKVRGALYFSHILDVKNDFWTPFEPFSSYQWAGLILPPK